jgi:hypothetical protein
VPSVALLCAPVDALGTGALLALGLAHAHRAPAGLLCLWGAGEHAVPAWTVPAFPGARRVLGALATHGLDAQASGRLVRLALPDDPEAALAAATRSGAVAGVPTVAVLSAPRTPALDQLLVAQDLAVVAQRADADPALGRLARQSLASLRVPAVTCPFTPGLCARALAPAGIAWGGRPAFQPAMAALT